MKNDLVVLVDIDGTISKVGDRLELLSHEPPNWDEFYARCGEDEPVQTIIEIIKSISDSGYRIVFCTGRMETVREITKDWIWRFLSMSVDESQLLMRKEGDFRHDIYVKPELISEAGIENKIFCIFEDRGLMVDEWLELGYTCLQVADGNF